MITVEVLHHQLFFLLPVLLSLLCLRTNTVLIQFSIKWVVFIAVNGLRCYCLGSRTANGYPWKHGRNVYIPAGAVHS